MDEHEKWRLEWEVYFDELDDAIHRLMDVADKADKEGFLEVQAQLLMAASSVCLLASKCEEFVNKQIEQMSIEIYGQNPLLKVLLEKARKSLDTSGDNATNSDLNRRTRKD